MKLNEWHFYKLTTGRFTGKCIRSSDPEVLRLALRKAPDCGAKEGSFNPQTQKVDLETDEVIEAEDVRRESAEEKRREWALSMIQSLESKQQRPMRELALNPDDEAARLKLQELETEVAGYRAILNGETDTTAR